jgi:parallel beta-helix repeat protein
MKTHFLIVVTIVLSLNCLSQTTVPAGSVSGTWTTMGSPYLIQGNIQISDGSTLSIQPGVSINFEGAYKLNVQGCLLAIGALNDSITITAADTSVGWSGIHFDNTPLTNDTSKIFYCRILYARNAGSNSGAFYFNNYSQMIISNSRISSCKAKTNGGIIFCYYSHPFINKNYLSNNLSNGILCSNSNPVISCNTILNNFGAGVYCDYSSPEIISDTISYNNGGGIYCDNHSSPDILNNQITNNSSAVGGGICCTNQSSPLISNNIIAYNTNGGICCISGSSIISSNKIFNNTSSGIHINSSYENGFKIINNTISNNTSFDYNYGGGGIFLAASSPVIISNTITNNHAEANGGGIYFYNGSNPKMYNTILYGNTGNSGEDQVYLGYNSSHPDFYNCDVQGGMNAFNGNSFSGTYQNNIDSDPMFVSPSYGSGSGYDASITDWSLQGNSPCIDKGNPDGIYSSTDITGNPRVTVCRSDIGAFEYQTGVPFDISLHISQEILCNGDSTGKIEAFVTGGFAPYSYQWSNGQTTATDSNLIAGNYSVTVNETGYGCSLSKSISLTEPMKITVNTGENKSIICGGSVQLDYPITNYTGLDTLKYSWFPSAGLSAADVAQPSAKVTENTAFVLSISSPNGCNAKDTVNVNVNPLIATVNDVKVSCGNTAHLEVTTNYTGSDTLSFKWSPSSGLSDTIIANPVATLKASAEYSVEVKTPNGCIANDNVNINVSVIDFTPSICMVTVNDSDHNVIVWQREQNSAIDSFYVYRLYQNNSYNLIGRLPYSAIGIFTDSSSNARIQSNTYTIAVKDGCGFVTEMSSEHKTMHLTINKGTGNNWNLIWEQYIGLPVSSYKIYRGTTKESLVYLATSPDNNTTYTDETAPAGNVFYQIEVILPQACSNLKSTRYESSRSNIISNSDVIDIYPLSKTEPCIYPNPASKRLTIKNNHGSNTTLMIIDMHGKQVLAKQINSDQIDISNLLKGFYIVKLIHSNNVLVSKFLKE